MKRIGIFIGIDGYGDKALHPLRCAVASLADVASAMRDDGKFQWEGGHAVDRIGNP